MSVIRDYWSLVLSFVCLLIAKYLFITKGWVWHNSWTYIFFSVLMFASAFAFLLQRAANQRR